MDWLGNGLYTLYFNKLQRPSRNWVAKKLRMRTNKLLRVILAMKNIIYLILIWPSFSFSAELDSHSYMGIDLGEQDAKSVAVFVDLFGEMKEGFSLYCLKGKEQYLIITVSNDTHHHFSRTDSVEISLYKPDIECSESKRAIEMFNGIRLNMYQSEMASILRSEGYLQGYSTSKQATYEKSTSEEPQCHHHKETEFDPEHYTYGSKKITLSFSLSGISAGKVGSIKKRLAYGFTSMENEDCGTRNKSKHADLVKLSPFLFQKSRQLHQAGV